MTVNGCNCSIAIKTEHHEFDVPYSDETLREAVCILEENASIEGDGECKGLRKVTGVTGCVVTPLTIKTAPLLLSLAFGSASMPLYVSETRNLHQYLLRLIPLEDTDSFELIQDRGNEIRLYERCRVSGFELRIMRDEAIKLKIDICSKCQTQEVSDTTSFSDTFANERFNGSNVTYKINGMEYKNIYGVTINAKKEGGTKTEIWIKRALLDGDVPSVIEYMTITAKLLRTQYEYRYYGVFRITLNKIVLVTDETNVNSADAVIGLLRFYVAGNITAEVFNNSEALIP